MQLPGVTFDFPPLNVQGLPMLADLNNLAQKLETDDAVKVVVFQSAHPEIFVAHADTNFLKDMSSKAVSSEEVKLLDLQVVLERISKGATGDDREDRGLRSRRWS